MLTRLGTSAVALAAAFTAAPSAAVADAEYCHGVDFDLKRPLVVSRIAAPSRVYFVRGADEKAACPSDAPACRRPDYLVFGDLVLTGKTQPARGAQGAYVCAAYQSPLARKQDSTNGWLPASSPRPVATAPAPKSSDWTGEWVHPGGSITIAEGGAGMLKVDGLLPGANAARRAVARSRGQQRMGRRDGDVHRPLPPEVGGRTWGRCCLEKRRRQLLP